MRGLRSTIALLVVLTGLGAYIYFVTWRQEADTGPKLDEVFTSLEAEDIQQLQVKSESGEVTSVKREGDAWQIVSPVAARASASEVSAITSALGQLEIVRVIDENAANLTEYGLDNPRIEINFTSAADKPSGKLLVGDKTPTGGGLYARRDDEQRVFLIPAYQEATLNKSTFDLRDKAVISIERDKISSVAVSTGGRAIEFERRAGEWTITKPIAARADFGSVEALVGRVETAQMKSVAAEDSTDADLRKYGLDRPDVSVIVAMGGERATLVLGRDAGEDAVYARDASRPAVFTVDNTLAAELKKNVDDYRRRDAFEFRAFSADRVELARSGQTVVFERVKGQGEAAQDSWRRASPNPGDVDKSKVESLLAGLADIRATSFTPSAANTGLNSPALTVSVKFEEVKEERVTFGTSGDDVYISRPDEPGAAKIEAEKFNEAIDALDELSK